MFCDFFAGGFVHDETLDGVGGFGGHFVELVFGFLHVAVKAPNVAAIPCFPVALGLEFHVSCWFKMIESILFTTYGLSSIRKFHNCIFQLVHLICDPADVVRIICKQPSVLSEINIIAKEILTQLFAQSL